MKNPETSLMGWLELEVSFFPEGGCLLSLVLSVNQTAGVGSAAPSLPLPLPRGLPVRRGDVITT